jgi:hypothetical protein
VRIRAVPSDFGVNDTSSRLKDVTAVVSATFAVGS